MQKQVMLDKGMTGSFSGKRLRAFLKHLSAEGLRSMVDGGAVIWFGSVGVGEVLYTPAAHLVLERGQEGSDITGLKCSFVVKDSIAISALEKLSKDEPGSEILYEALKAAQNEPPAAQDKHEKQNQQLDEEDQKGTEGKDKNEKTVEKLGEEDKETAEDAHQDQTAGGA